MTPVGSLAGGTFGAAVLAAGFVSAVRPRAAVLEPKLLDILALYGYPFLPSSIFKKLYMSEESFEGNMVRGSANTRHWLLTYFEGRRLELVGLREEALTLLDDLRDSYGLSLDEALAILLAVQEDIGIVLLYRPEAWRLAKELGLDPWGPRKVVLMAYGKGLLSKEEIYKLSHLSFKVRDLPKLIALEARGGVP